MTSISEDVYEASRIDGANGVQTFFRITLPMLAPVLKVVLMLAITGAFKDYEAIMVLTNGGPGTRTNVMFLYIYNLIFGTGANSTRQIRRAAEPDGCCHRRRGHHHLQSGCQKTG